MNVEGLAAVAALWLLGSKKAKAEQQPAVAAAKPVEEPKNPLGVLGSAAEALVPMFPAAAAAPVAAAPTAAAAPAAAAPTAAAAAPAGAAGAAVAAPVAAVTLGAVAAASWVLSYVVLAVVAKLVNTAIEYSKSFEQRIYFNNPNARAMCTFELAYARARLEVTGRTWTETEVRDWRLDQTYASNGATSRGYRTVLSYLPKAEEQVELLGGARGDLLAANARYLAQQFLDYRGRVAASQIRHWLRRKYEESWGWGDAARFELYEALQPGLGGLEAVPLVSGRTIRSRSDYSEASPPMEELKAAPGLLASQNGLPMGEIQLARALGVVDGLQAVRWDPTVYVGLTPEQYAADTWDRCQMAQFRGVRLNGAAFDFDAQEWGVAFQFWPYNAMKRTGEAVQLLQQPAPLPRPALSPSAKTQIAMGF